jgi:tetratricopeptide (TPR) repeat protein
MTRDNIVYTACGLLLGLVIGSFLIGPKLAQSKLAGSQTAAVEPSMPPGAATPAAGGAQAAPMEAVRRQLDDLKAKVAANPNDFESLVQLGNMYSDVAKYPQAIDYYERALRIREDANVRTDLGISYKQSGRLDDAHAAFERVSQESPESWQAIYNLAVVDGEMRRFDDARKEVAKLKAMRPNDPDVAKLVEALKAAK